MHIRIDTPQVADVGRRLISDGQRIAQIGQWLSAAVGRLDWESRARIGMEDDFAAARSRAEALGQQLVGHGERLIRIAETFDRADTESVRDLSAIPWADLIPAAGGGVLAWRDALRRTVGEVAFLGGFVGTVGTLQATGWRSFGECLWNWLHGRGWRSNQQIQAEAAARERQRLAQEERRRREEARRRQEEEEARKREEEAERRRQKAARAVQRPVGRYNVPPLKQKARSYECAPTSASMLLQYYHQQNPDHKAVAPQELIRKLGSRFDPHKGIGADKLVEGLREMDLGYKTIEWQAKLNQEQLRAELQQGPVMAQVRLNLAASGYPHMVVVTGMSDDGKRVYLNDPWTGGRREVAWDTFERSWTFDNYPEYSHLVVVIRP